MKKLICAVLGFLIAFGSLGGIVHAVAGVSENITADEFAREVGGLIMSADESSNLPATRICKCENDCSEFETARLIVKSRNKIDTLNASSVISGYDNLWILQFDSCTDASAAYDYYSSRAGIEHVEADKVIQSTDPAIIDYNPDTEENSSGNLSWGPEHIGINKFNSDILEKAPSISDTVVAIVDTGVDPDHPFLEGRVIPTKINTSSSGIRNNSEDDHGHGTRIAGIIADCTLDNVYIKPYKVMDKYGNGTVITVAAGINCAVKDGVDVINISIGFEEDSEILRTAIRNAEENDIVVVGAAGNDASETIYYPASYSTVLKVTAITEENIFANFSSYGNDVDIAAPGVDIVTTNMGGGYITVKGTSFASPFVAAAAAAINSVIPKVSAEDIRNIIRSSAVEVNEYEADLKFGSGILFMPHYSEEHISDNKTDAPHFSHFPAYYTENVNLEIFCVDESAEIYYTTDRTVPSKTNSSAIRYDGNPVILTETTILMAVAYSEGKYRSSISTFSAFVIPYANESELTVDSDGTLLSYSGTALNITIPEKVNGITVTKVGDGVFANTDLTEIVLPRSVTEIGNSAFENCRKLRTISAFNTTKLGKNALYGCTNIRNIYFGKLTDIGEYAFYNAGKDQFILEERSFSLDLSNLKSIPEGSFMGSSISHAEFDAVDNIGKNAFAECNALVSVRATKVGNLGDSAFRGCASLADVEILGLTYIPPSTFSTCTNLYSIKLPDATLVNSNAFENCIAIRGITLESAQTVYSNAFSGCSSLRTINLPEMTAFENIFNPSLTIIPSFPASLEVFNAPKLEATVSNMFFHSKNIKNIHLDSVQEIAPSTFYGCNNIFFLDISKTRSINQHSFNNCRIEFIDARSLEITHDMPDNSGILLSNNFIESTDNAVNLTVYGTPNTFVERYSNYKGYHFVAIPLVYNELPEYVTANSETIYISAVGFDLTYQWYENTVKSTEGGTPIKGAVTSSYTFTEDDKSPYYYCVMTQNDMGNISSISTHVITKDTTPADYTAYNEAVRTANEIDREIYENIILLDSALEVDVSGRFSCEQEFVDSQTAAILDAIQKLKLKSVKSVNLSASKTNLGIFETAQIDIATFPADGIYTNIEWYSENMNVIFVSKNGTARCLGNGTATVHAKVTNADGSITDGTITFNCELTKAEKIISFLLRPIFLIAYSING